MGVSKLFLIVVLVPCVFCQEPGACYGAGSVAGAAIGAFLGALILIGIAYYLRKLYWKSRKGKHLVFTTDPESVKDEFAFDNPGFRQEEKQAWQHDAPTLPLGSKGNAIQVEFTKPEQSKDDSHLQRARVRHLKLWARDFTGLGLRCGGGAREGVIVHSVLRSGPAAAAKLQPGDRIKSIKIEFVGMPLEDAVSILSLASPYPVEFEVQEGGRASGAGRGVHHPLLKRAGSTGDVSTLEKEASLLYPPKSPNTSHSNNSTLETIKKVISDKIISTTTLERNKREKKDGVSTTIERENEKNKPAHKSRHSDISPTVSKPDRNKNRHSLESMSQTDNGTAHIEHSEIQKRDYDPKRAMKFGIRVLPPNIPDDGVLKQKNVENGVVNVEKTSVDELDKPEPQRPPPTQIRHENETEIKKPVVTKRREKVAPPVPNVRVKLNESDNNSSLDTSKTSETSTILTTFSRNDLNSSGIKRDENGIPQELPQHMFDAAKAARSNRKSTSELIQEKDKVEHKKEEAPKPKQEMTKPKIEVPKPKEEAPKPKKEVPPPKEEIPKLKEEAPKPRKGVPLPKEEIPKLKEEAPKPRKEVPLPKEEIPKQKEEAPKLSKKSKGKAPSPPDSDKNKTDESILEQIKNIKDFLKNEKLHSSILHDSTIMSTDRSGVSYTSTPKVDKTKSSSRLEESINFSQEDIDDIVSKPFKRESDSLNNFFEDNKSNLSSNQDVFSVVSLNQSDKSDKGSTTIELNNSDITIHSSPTNETVHSVSDNTSIVDENERKVASLGDLSRFDLRTKTSKPTTGTLERAQSLDISGDDAEQQESTLSPKKRKAMSVVENVFLESGTEDISSDIDSGKIIVLKHKEPRLSLNIAKSSAIEGLSTFQRNRLKKASEFGNLEDAIVKGSTTSIDTDRQEDLSKRDTRNRDFDLYTSAEAHETSDHLAKRIMDENMRVHLKLVSEFAKTTSDGSNMSSLDSTQGSEQSRKESSPTKYEEKLTMSYDTNIPDDLKVSRNTYVNSLERPKSDMMKKLLAKNPILNVHIDQSSQKNEAKSSTSKETPTPMTDASKSAIQPDIVNFDLKSSEPKPKERDYDDFVSNIRVGSNNNTLNFNKKTSHESFKTQWSEPKDSHTSDVVIITTEKSQPVEEVRRTYTKSIEIGEPTLRLIPDIVDTVKRRSDDKDSRTLYMEPANMSLTMRQEPVEKTVTVNVAEDEFGNKVITQNVETISSRYITAKSEAPLQVEQISFGMMKNAGNIDFDKLEEGDVKDIDKRVLEQIKRQNPNMVFTSEEPSYTKTETIILNTEMDEEQAQALMAKLQNDPSFMAQKTPEELSRMGIRIIHDLEDVQTSSRDAVEHTKTRYSINPSIISETNRTSRIHTSKDSEMEKDHITEIQVVTPRTEKIIKQKSESSKDKTSSRQRVPSYEEPPLSYELDLELLNDFISNERHHSAKQLADAKKRTNTNQSEPKKRHSDYDLPRNSHIKFRTATYESPKGTLVTSTDLENRRLSQLDQMQLRAMNDQPAAGLKPVISMKPSNLPVKDKQKQAVVSSKIPVFMTQKSPSQESLTERSFSLPRSPPPGLSSSSAASGSTNITVTSIKSSSRSPSGGML